jgi:hypothetical protein
MKGAHMPQFFLHIEYGDGSALSDHDGAEFPDADAAILEARRALKELVCETIDVGGRVVATHMNVMDDGGAELEM